MNIRQLRDLAIKFIGLQCLAMGVTIVFQAIAMFDFPLRQEHFWRGITFLSAFCVAALLYSGMAYLLLFRSRVIAGFLWPDKEEEEEPAGATISATLEICVALVGLYYIPEYLHKVTAECLSLAMGPGVSFGYQFYATIIGQIVLLVVAALCIIKAKAIAAHIRNYTE